MGSTERYICSGAATFVDSEGNTCTCKRKIMSGASQSSYVFIAL